MKLGLLTRPMGYLFQAFLLKSTWQQYKKQGVLAYLKCLQTTRKGVACLLLLLLSLQAIVIGLIGGGIVVVFLTVEDNRTRLWILLGIFATAFIVPLLAIGYLLSQRLWLRLSGAEKAVENINKSG